jgi:hypothetical protein
VLFQSLNLAPLGKANNVICRAICQCLNRAGWLPAPRCDEAAAIADEQIRHVVRAVVGVDDRAFRLFAHPASAEQMTAPVCSSTGKGHFLRAPAASSSPSARARKTQIGGMSRRSPPDVHALAQRKSPANTWPAKPRSSRTKAGGETLGARVLPSSFCVPPIRCRIVLGNQSWSGSTPNARSLAANCCAFCCAASFSCRSASARCASYSARCASCAARSSRFWIQLPS